MSLAMLIEAAQLLLLVAAWLWRGGNDRMTYALLVAFVVSAWIGMHLTGIDRQAALGVLDAVLVSFAAREWINHYDTRGWSIGLLGLSKIGLRFGYATLDLNHTIFAAVINATFIAQVFIAGGMADGLGRRIADHLRSAGPRGARLLRNVEGR